MPRSKPPPGTLVFLVRHGQTPTTGTTLPGRANGLHLADTGREQASAVAERLAPSRARSLPSTPRRSSGPARRRPDRQAARAAGSTSRGLLECDFGDWTGQELKTLMKLPEWKQVQRYPSGFRFPGGESFVEMQTRIVDTVQPPRRQRIAGKVVVAVSHADPIKAAVAHALGHPPRPVPAHRDLAVLGHRDRLRHRQSGRADRQLDRRRLTALRLVSRHDR